MLNWTASMIIAAVVAVFLVVWLRYLKHHKKIYGKCTNSGTLLNEIYKGTLLNEIYKRDGYETYVFIKNLLKGGIPDVFAVFVVSVLLLLFCIAALYIGFKNYPSDSPEVSNDAEKTMRWSKALVYCQDLEENGYSDWKLPTTAKLSGLNKSGGNYWSSDMERIEKKYDNDEDKAWFYDFSAKKREKSFVSTNMHVVCIRNMPKHAKTESEQQEFQNGKNKFETEYNKEKINKTGHLEWSRPSNKMDWNAAKQYCDNLAESGFTDWRLPNIDELRTLIKNCPKTETDGECKVSEKNGHLSSEDWRPKGSCYCDSRQNNSGYYSKLDDDDKVWLWSSSTISDLNDRAWRIDFSSGTVDYSHITTSVINVRCVR